jgi:hypothetical protein
VQCRMCPRLVAVGRSLSFGLAGGWCVLVRCCKLQEIVVVVGGELWSSVIGHRYGTIVVGGTNDLLVVWWLKK